jgi:hypothetical protein
VPNPATGAPVFASMATKWYQGVTRKIRPAVPSVQ